MFFHQFLGGFTLLSFISKHTHTHSRFFRPCKSLIFRCFGLPRRIYLQFNPMKLKSKSKADEDVQLFPITPSPIDLLKGEKKMQSITGEDGNWYLYESEKNDTAIWAYTDAAGEFHPSVCALILPTRNRLVVQDAYFGFKVATVPDLEHMEEADIFAISMEMLNYLRFNTNNPTEN